MMDYSKTLKSGEGTAEEQIEQLRGQLLTVQEETVIMLDNLQKQIIRLEDKLRRMEAEHGAE